MSETFDCECDDGCPFCLYQFGCTARNDPDSFDKAAVAELVDRGLHLTPHEGE